ncbi:RteC domain-containing protein [Cellulophaga baltica]|uniref:RteC domain-containing protein n=1 Tax=Cellulophaga baltica TaxID=76594 RepID=UPI002494E16E|nr:RteC domain-containing protein [Cellulophaga baltica]
MSTGDIKADYYDHLKRYLKNNPDSKEVELVENEIEFYEKLIADIDSGKITEELGFNLHLEELIEYKKYLNFFRDKLRLLELENESNPNPNKTSSNQTLETSMIKFNLSQTEIIELTKALIENGNIKGKQKDIINAFKVFFSVEINNPNKLITDIKKRNHGSETLFIDKLKSSLHNYITSENVR